jgi:hypothetical protein
MLTVRRSFRAGGMMISKQWICGAGLALLAGGCNTTTFTTKANTPVVVHALGMYAQADCTSWEPPEATVTEQPANGRVTSQLIKYPIVDKGHHCEGKVIDRRMITYIPKSGFRGQDRFSVGYEFITNDAGGRGAQRQTFVVDVK